MMTTTHDLVEQYLQRLTTAARALPRGPREELIAEIREHLRVGIQPEATEAEARNVLDDLGQPGDIVAAALPDGPPAPQRGAREILAVLLLLTGFPPFLGWFVGLGLLVASPLWTVRQKWLGALVWPGGLLVVFFGGGLLAVGLGSISQGPIALALAAAPVFVAAYLYRAAGRNSANA